MVNSWSICVTMSILWNWVATHGDSDFLGGCHLSFWMQGCSNLGSGLVHLWDVATVFSAHARSVRIQYHGYPLIWWRSHLIILVEDAVFSLLCFSDSCDKGKSYIGRSFKINSSSKKVSNVLVIDNKSKLNVLTPVWRSTDTSGFLDGAFHGTVLSKKPDTKWWNFPWNFTESSTETKLWNFSWNFYGKFHRDKTVELSVDIALDAMFSGHLSGWCYYAIIRNSLYFMFSLLKNLIVQL